MGKTDAGGILAIIGGIFGILAGFIWLILGIFAIIAVATEGAGAGAFIVALIPVLGGIYVMVTGSIVIKAGIMMKDPLTCKKGGLLALIFSIIGGGTILGLIGGILGLVEADK